jgi:RNA polymerase sigma-70 factor (ECF subfamily)
MLPMMDQPTSIRPGATPSTDQRAAFNALYADMAQSTTRYAGALLGRAGREEVEDVVQEAWARAWRHWDSADDGHRPAWVLRIVRNCCIDRHRRRRPIDSLADHDEVAVPVDETDHLARWEAEATLERLNALPITLRTTLILRVVHDHSYAEIARIEQIPIGTVMSRLHAARQRLARELRPWL